MTRLAPTLVVVGLLAATALAFGVSERLKLEQSPVQSTAIDRLFSPTCTMCRPEARQAEIRFRLRVEDHLTVDIVDQDGVEVRKGLVSARRAPGPVLIAWDGRDERGTVVGDGLYRVRVTLDSEDRTLEFPGEIRVDTKAPAIDSIEVSPQAISPDGDRRSDRATVRYRFGEEAYAILYVNGKRQPGRSFRKRPAGSLQWYALGRKPGTYRLALAAQDLAGNTSSTREFAVRVRFVELARQRFRVRPTAMFRVRVATDANRMTYRFAGRTVPLRQRKALRSFWVRAPESPGRYLLTVRAGAHLDRATVLVRR